MVGECVNCGYYGEICGGLCPGCNADITEQRLLIEAYANPDYNVGAF